uniref:Peptidase M12B domain-containing protein n=1 Tax=Wuchereria bancrofti TaxID=6293 RepID=A0A1I8EUL1_WUCBA
MYILKVEMSRNLRRNGNATLLLDLFCIYQAKLNRNSKSTKRWDHALLFTGYVSYLRCYAPMNGMCKEKNSCTISEGHDFSAIFIVAHEIGYKFTDAKILPGQMFTLDERYIFMEHVGSMKLNMANILCGNGEGHCKVAIPEFTILRHGSSSDWKDGGCVMECVPCQTSGQIRVQRSLRICDNP